MDSIIYLVNCLIKQIDSNYLHSLLFYLTIRVNYIPV